MTRMDKITETLCNKAIKGVRGDKFRPVSDTANFNLFFSQPRSKIVCEQNNQGRLFASESHCVVPRRFIWCAAPFPSASPPFRRPSRPPGSAVAAALRPISGPLACAWRSRTSTAPGWLWAGRGSRPRRRPRWSTTGWSPTWVRLGRRPLSLPEIKGWQVIPNEPSKARKRAVQPEHLRG